MNAVAARLGELGAPPARDLARREWDVVVVGAGHNGLAAAAYLARAGRNVLVLERRERVGGACTLERPFADERFVSSPCAYLLGLLDERVIRELGLRRRGLQTRLADPELFVPLGDGTAFVQWLDEERTAGGLRELGVRARDIEGLRAYNALFDRARRLLRKGRRDAWVGDAPDRAEVEELLGHEEGLIDLVFHASIAEVLEGHFRDQRIRDALAAQGLIAAYGGPRAPGTAWIHLMHHMGELDGQGGAWGYVRGGIGMVSFALADAALEGGATIACGLPVAAVAPGEGVELEDGTRIPARAVISNADPKAALRMLESAGAGGDFLDALRSWRVRSPVLKLNAALRSLPRWPAAGGETWPAQGTINVTTGIEGCERAFEACERGAFELGYAELYCQSAADPSVAPDGMQTMSAFCQYAPYEPAVGGWDVRAAGGETLRERAAREVIAAVERFAPGFAGLVVEHEVLAPPDIEARIGLAGGQIFQGECSPEQMWDRRLAARTPLPGFYLCGAATHPGGSVIGLNGRNAAAALLADAGEALAA